MKILDLLPHAEAENLRYLKYGHTIKEIAHFRKIGHDVVAAQLRVTRKRFGYNSNGQLIAAMWMEEVAHIVEGQLKPGDETLWLTKIPSHALRRRRAG